MTYMQLMDKFSWLVKVQHAISEGSMADPIILPQNCDARPIFGSLFFKGIFRPPL